MKRRIFKVCLISLVIGVAVEPLRAQDALGGASQLTPAQEGELDYADKLLAAGLPGYSAMVMSKLNLPPEIMNIRKVRGLGAQNKMAEAEAIVAANPGDTEGAWTLKLTLADMYYAWGQYDKAQALYDAFFKRFPNGPQDDALKSFYMGSAYKYAQMMLLMNNRKAAAEAYRMALKAKPEQHIKRMLQSELCDVLIVAAEATTVAADRTALLAETKTLVDDLLWIQDVWFGRAVVAMAYMHKLNGNIEKALSLVDDYMTELKGIDEALKAQSTDLEDLTKLSPMAQCRYMVAKIMQEEADKILKEGGDKQKALELLAGKRGALNHFVNVFARYPNTAWAPDAGTRFRQIEEQLKQVWDKTINVPITPEQWAAVETAQFREARALFNQQRFTDAATLYEQLLSVFPDRETAVQGLGELAACYIENGEEVLADTVVRHTAERFNKHKDLMALAGDQVVRIAFKYGEQNKPEKMRETYGVFFEYFKNHPRTVLELYRFADEAFRNKEFDLAMGYFQRIVKDHEGKPAYIDSLNRIAMIHEEQGNAEEQVKALNVLIKKLEERGEKVHLQINAMYRFAVALRGMGPKFTDVVVKKFTELEDLLKDETKRQAYQKNPEETKANVQVLQAAMLFRAMTDASRKVVPAPIQAMYDKKNAGKPVPPDMILKNHYKVPAVNVLQELVKLFPDSPYAPTALSQMGALYTVLGKPDEARQALQRLQKEYKDSKEAANAQYMLSIALLGMDMRTEAVASFKQMFSAQGGEFNPSQVLSAGRELLAAGEFEIAVEAFDRIIQTVKERNLLEPARVGKGQALVRLNRFPEAMEVLDKVLVDYPNSGMTVEICRSASLAYAAVASETADAKSRFDLFNKAIDAIKRARRLVKDAGVQTEMDVVVAQILERKMQAEGKFGTPATVAEYRNDAVAAYQSVMMFRNPKDAAVAPHLEDAYAGCITLLVDMERWDDVVQDAQSYLDAFPKGKHVLTIRQALNKARVSGGAGASPAPAGGAPEALPAATPVAAPESTPAAVAPAAAPASGEASPQS